MKNLKNRLKYYVLRLSKVRYFNRWVILLIDLCLSVIATAVIEVKQGFELTEQEVNDFCMGLPRYQRPRKIIFAQVPRNPTGKIEKPKLRKLYGADLLVAKQNEIQ